MSKLKDQAFFLILLASFVVFQVQVVAEKHTVSDLRRSQSNINSLPGLERGISYNPDVLIHVITDQSHHKTEKPDPSTEHPDPSTEKSDPTTEYPNPSTEKSDPTTEESMSTKTPILTTEVPVILDNMTVKARPCNVKRKSIRVNCTIADLKHYGCCPMKLRTNLCDPTIPDYCGPYHNCRMYQLNLTHYSKGHENISQVDIFKCKRINPYQNFTLRHKASKKQIRPHFGRPCNKELYDRRMRPIWEKYLTCPWDPEPHEMFETLKEDWQRNRDIMDNVCLSPFIEACGENNTCECFSKVFMDDMGQVYLNFTQVKERRNHCGLVAGSQCTFNTQSVMTGRMRKQCKYMPLPGVLVPDPFDCERDAMCDIDFKTHQCSVGRTCTCQCALGFECIGHGSLMSRSAVLIYLLVVSIILF